MTGALILFGVWAVLGIAAAVVFISACVCGARDDRMMEAWRAERERATAAMDAQVGGWRNGAA